ncbi:MAG: DUF3887 domain-containing protein [Bacteroidales bacterium]
MKRVVFYLILVFSLSPVFLSAKAVHPKVEKVVYELEKNNFSKVHSLFSKNFKKRVKEESVKELWSTFIQMYGDFESIGKSYKKPNGKYFDYLTILKFKEGLASMRITLNQEEEVVGFQLDQAGERKPEYEFIDSKSIFEKEITFNSKGTDLSGTLTLPKKTGKFPLVVFVHDLGPLNRNSTIGRCDFFKDFAHRMAEYGIACFRYDKRNFIYGQGQINNFDEEIVDDAVAALQQMESVSEIDKNKIFVAAHGVGGMFAARIGQNYGKLKGLVLLAPAVRPLYDVAYSQIRYIANLDGKMSDAEQARLLQMKKSMKIVANLNEESNPKERVLLFPNSYWLNMQNYDAVGEAKKLNVPIMVAWGDRDYKTTDVDFNIWDFNLKDYKAGATLKKYPYLNHLFVRGRMPSSPAEYCSSGNVFVTPIDDISYWIIRNM